jgi:hypothetical protein
MIVVFLLLVIANGFLSFRAQSKRQHREMMAAVNPERLAALNAAEHAEARRKWAGILSA